jgi:2-(1,2-epoxy-1,2-dihydrophenyl)acetyl-CoA isomerase
MSHPSRVKEKSSVESEVLIDLRVRDGVAVVRLNRSTVYNALNLALAEALFAAVIGCDENPDVRSVVITGAGMAFCAGGDIREMKEYVERDGHAGVFLKRLTIPLHAAIATISRMPKPVVAAVNGPAAGAGFSLAMAGDVILASETASFTVGYTGIGLPPDGGLSFHLTRAVGPKVAFDLAFSNRRLTAREALDLGLVTAVLPAASFEAEVEVYAKRLAEGPTQALAHCKRLIKSGALQSLETQMEDERQAVANCGRSADFKEGVTAFLEKRQATYRGC